jgi:membrane-associated protease RseP (regulator of RpoE activity)
MKQIIELKKNIADHNFLMAQFDIDPGYAILEVPESQLRFGDRIVGEINDLYKIERQEKILFVNPQLSGKYLYKMIIPYLKASSVPGLAIAITSLSDY